MDPKVLKLILDTVEKEQQEKAIFPEKKGVKSIERLRVAQEVFTYDFKKEVDMLEDIPLKDLSKQEVIKIRKEHKLVYEKLDELITEYFARFPAEQYHDYNDIKEERMKTFNTRFSGQMPTEPFATYDTYIPKGFLIDHSFDAKTEYENSINQVYVNDVEKIVVWVIKGIDFPAPTGKDIGDVMKILGTNMKDWATTEYVTMAFNIVRKYKFTRDIKRHKIYMSSHSRGASIQLALLTFNWAGEMPTNLNEEGKKLFRESEELYPYEHKDLSLYIDGAFLYTPGYPPLKFLTNWITNKIYPEINKKKQDRLKNILNLGFVRGASILKETLGYEKGKGEGIIGFDPISVGASFDYPYGNKFYVKQRSLLPHTIFNFLPEYITDYKPMEKPNIQLIEPVQKYETPIRTNMFDIPAYPAQMILTKKYEPVDTSKPYELAPTVKKGQLSKLTDEEYEELERKEYEILLKKMREEYDEMQQEIKKMVVVEPTHSDSTQTNLIYGKNKLSDDIDIDMSSKRKYYGYDAGSKEAAAAQRGYRDKIAGLSPTESGEAYLKGYNPTGTSGRPKKKSIIEDLEREDTEQPKFTQEKSKARSGGGAGGTERTAPKKEPEFESKAKRDYNNPKITIENQVESMFTGQEIPQFQPRIKQESKVASFTVDKDGTLKKTFTVGKDTPSSIKRLTKKRVDVHKGNKLEAPLLPEVKEVNKTTKSKAMKEKEAKEKAPAVKKITKAQKIYKL